MSRPTIMAGRIGVNTKLPIPMAAAMPIMPAAAVRIAAPLLLNFTSASRSSPLTGCSGALSGPDGGTKCHSPRCGSVSNKLGLLHENHRLHSRRDRHRSADPFLRRLRLSGRLITTGKRAAGNTGAH
jgi:hypothetical protein